jgi:ribosome-associated protein
VSSKELATRIAAAAWEKKAKEVRAIEVRDLVGYTDYVVVCTGTNDRHVNAIAQSIEDTIREDLGEKPLGVEGRRSGRWILLDFEDVVVHVMHEPVREFYALERIWADAPRLELEEPEWMKDNPSAA